MPDAVDGVAIGSVVPRVTGPLSQGCQAYFTVGAPLIVDASSRLPITLDVDEPLTVGADRLINTLAASRLYGRDAIVVDLGTATTFDCITSDGVFLGGVIAPGILTSSETLTRRTSKLPATELSIPKRVIGRRTEECIRAGVMFGAADAIDGIVGRIKREWPRPSVPTVIATGGFASTMAELCQVVRSRGAAPDAPGSGAGVQHSRAERKKTLSRLSRTSYGIGRACVRRLTRLPGVPRLEGC